MTTANTLCGAFTALFILIGVLFVHSNQVSALTIRCIIPQNIFIAAYEQDTFIDGFVVQHKETEDWCNTRPVVSDHTENIQNIFSIVSHNLSQPVATGIYQLSTRCLAEAWEEKCTQEATLEQLSNDPKELAQYKTQWQEKEKKELLSVTAEKWSVPSIVIAIVVISLLWPWILVKIWPNLRKHLSLFLIIAIVLQIALALKLPGMFIWSQISWQATASISSIILVLFITGEIIFLVARKIRSIKATV